METITQDSATEYEAYYELKNRLPEIPQEQEQEQLGTYIKELQKELETEIWKTSQRDPFTKVITYLNNHKASMKYNEYLANGYPIATGVVESACGHIVKDRMELSGARWSIDGAEAMLRVRSVVKSQD